MISSLKSSKQSGHITAMLLIVTAISSIILYALAILITNQYQLSQRQTASELAVTIAEAGINYYRWHLAHAPNDFTDGTGQPGPYVHSYNDPQSGSIGQYSLEITPPNDGSSIVLITSTGWTNEFPDIKRTIKVQYGEPSMAQFAFLHDSHIWLGEGLEVFGPVHSNGGIRQDGLNHSLVTSALSSYTCGSETGCSPSQTRPGVWGDGGDTGLWEYPSPPVDFNAISVDFANMKTAAQDEGLYLSSSGSRGYHLIFNADGTFRLYRITGTTNRRGYDSSVGCIDLYQGIQNQTLLGTYNQSDVPIIFAEDHLWLEGTLTSSTEIVAARFPLDTNNADIWLYNNFTYSNTDGSIQGGIIAQQNIYFARDIPNDFRIHGALLAQKGRIMRHHYAVSYCSPSSNAVRDTLTIYGAVISAQKSYWNWGTAPVSGFETRDITYDANLKYSPPPYFPTTGEYEFISWTE